MKRVNMDEEQCAQNFFLDGLNVARAYRPPGVATP